MKMVSKLKLQVNTFVVTQISGIKKSYIIHQNLFFLFAQHLPAGFPLLV